MRAINRVAVQVKNRKIDEAEIQEYMKTGKTELPKDFKEIMDQQIQIFVDKVYRYQTECGYSLDMMPVYFVGGGAVVMRNFGRYQQSNIHYVLDEMKSVFYYMFKGKADALQILMFKYKYPNIQRQEVEAFCNDLLFLLGSRREMKEEGKFLAGMLARAAESDELVFLHDNDDYVMQENYAEFYADPIRKYQKSRHIFDEETTVQDIVKKQIAMGENPGFLCSIGPWDGIGILNRFFEMVKSRKEK